MTRVSLAIKCYLKKYSISKREAAKQIGLHPSTFNKFLDGDGLGMSQETYAKIAAWLLQPH